MTGWTDEARKAALEARRRKSALHLKHVREAKAMLGTIEGAQKLYRLQKHRSRYQHASSLRYALAGLPQYANFSKYSKAAAAAQAFRWSDRRRGQRKF
jgi:hypothetical protein